jgi:hypothetical protein
MANNKDGFRPTSPCDGFIRKGQLGQLQLCKRIKNKHYFEVCGEKTHTYIRCYFIIILTSKI